MTHSVAQEAAGAERGQVIAPGATIGILGGGQLGRMTALAAARLGYRVHSYCPEANSPAFQVSAASTTAAYDDRDALARFAGSVDVITFEFENVPSATAELLAAMKPTRPRPQVLHICQHRLREKDFLTAARCRPPAITRSPMSASSRARQIPSACRRC